MKAEFIFMYSKGRQEGNKKMFSSLEVWKVW